jgi:hypothetical protein
LFRGLVGSEMCIRDSRISAIGVGPARDATIVLHDMLG